MKNQRKGHRKNTGSGYRKKSSKIPEYKFIRDPNTRNPDKETQKPVRLNSFIARAGICSRREADNLIQEGAISVNGKVERELGTKINRTDLVKYKGKPVKKERSVYVLLNKPKDFITTTNDPQERHTVMELISNACDERIYPVGRLDRNTTGLLLFTNDGDLTDKLAHPSNNIQKLYEVELDKPVEEQVLDKIKSGITLEDGMIRADDIQIVPF